MNMKYSLVFIIVLGLLCGCVRQRKADASDTGSIEMTQSETDALTADSVPLQGAEGTSDSLQGQGNAIYYWKTVFRLTEYDRQFLKKHHIRKIYLRMFDVDYGENMDGELEVLPFATTLFQDTIPAGIEIVPTVYITTKAIRQDVQKDTCHDDAPPHPERAGSPGGLRLDGQNPESVLQIMPKITG